MLIHPVDTRFPIQLLPIRGEHDFVLPSDIGKFDELGRMIFRRPCTRVDVPVFVLPGYCHGFCCPRISDITHDNFQVWELVCDGVDVGNWSTGLARASWSRMSHLRQERYIEFNTLDEQWPVMSVRGWKVRQPGDNPEAHEALHSHVMFELRDSLYRVVQINGG